MATDTVKASQSAHDATGRAAVDNSADAHARAATAHDKAADAQRKAGNFGVAAGHAAQANTHRAIAAAAPPPPHPSALKHAPPSKTPHDAAHAISAAGKQHGAPAPAARK